MGTKRKKDGNNGPAITFDAKARHAFITGFRKRKQERRKKGAAQVAELERQDRINVKWEHREDVKRTWKEVQWAERRVDKLFGPDGPLRLKNKSEDEDADEKPKKGKKRRKVAALENGEVEAITDGRETVAFDAEDDDPFGGCEVTTTVGCGGLALTVHDAATAAGAYGGAGAGQSSEGPLMLALREKRNAGRDLAHPGMTPAEHAARIQRRTENLRKQEAIRLTALAKREKKQMAEKKKMKKKKSKKDKKGDKNRKTTAKARRRRKQK
mmetsp:Transcript_110584/g.276975  ORF Transcript_110584/g.276975 Transcript_110584/m.276975 type:complete len:269 (+) Transcript_110584:112-918(+)